MYPSNIDEYFKLSPIVPQEWLSLAFYKAHVNGESTSIQKLGDIELFSYEQNKQISVMGNIYFFSVLCDKYFIRNYIGSVGLPTVVIDNTLSLSTEKFISIVGDFCGFIAMNQHLFSIISLPENVNFIIIDGNTLANIDFIDKCEKVVLLSIVNCGLKTADVDRILKAFVDFGTTGIELDVNNNEPPSELGLTYIATLVSRGWTVVYDEPLS